MPTPPMADPSRAPDSTWRTAARCRGHDAEHFFTPPHLESRAERVAREALARELCRSCTVRPQCLDYALTVGEPHGIWGGLTESERRRIARGGWGGSAAPGRPTVPV